jgi:UDP-glucose 4-epimerase
VTARSITITGASGYIGSSVAVAAVRAGIDDVRCVVRHASTDLPGRIVRVDDLRDDAHGVVAGSDAVIHLAAPNEVRTASDPDRATEDTVEIARAVTGACAHAGVKRLVYVSTVHVYGDALAPGAVVDEATPPQPNVPYAAARLACEQEIGCLAADCEVVVLRLTNAVGPPARPSMDRWTLVANDLCRQAARGSDLLLRSSGLQWRDFIPMSDVTDVLLAAADGRIPPGTFNLGSGTPITILQLAEMVAGAAARAGLARPAVIPGTAGPTEQSEPFHLSVAAIARAGFATKGDLARELQDTIAFCLRRPGPSEGDV